MAPPPAVLAGRSVDDCPGVQSEPNLSHQRHQQLVHSHLERHRRFHVLTSVQVRGTLTFCKRENFVRYTKDTKYLIYHKVLCHRLGLECVFSCTWRGHCPGPVKVHLIGHHDNGSVDVHPLPQARYLPENKPERRLVRYRVHHDEGIDKHRVSVSLPKKQSNWSDWFPEMGKKSVGSIGWLIGWETDGCSGLTLSGSTSSSSSDDSSPSRERDTWVKFVSSEESKPAV